MIKNKYRKIISELTSLTSLNLFAAAISYSLTIIIANTIGPNNFGIYSYILVWGGFASLIIIFSTESTIPVQFSKTKDKQGIFNLTQTIKILFLLIWIISIPLWLRFTELGLIIKSNPEVIIGLIILSLANFRTMEFYEISKKNVRYAKIYFIERMFYIFLVGIFLYQNSLDILTIFSCLFIATFFSLLFQFKDNFNLIKQFKIEKFHNVISLFKANLPLVLIQLSTFVYGGFSRIILEGKVGLEQLGIYSAGWQIILVITIFQGQVVRVWRTDLSSALINKNKKLIKDLISSYLLFSTFPVFIFAILVSIFSYEIVSLLFRDEYILLARVIPIFSLFFVFINLDSLAKILWISIGDRTKYLIISLFFSILLLFILQEIPNNSNLELFALSIFSMFASSVIALLLIFYFQYFRKI
jgi:O-antigen/teichoic acid export membrane protein|tara:strand:- start:637 stop:1881 length:1245 start_codon:yes stop_codon:yes gene_type:complete